MTRNQPCIFLRWFLYQFLDRFSEKHLASAPAGIFAQFDRMRRKRNNAFYDLALISDTEAEEAVKVSEEYLKLVSADLAARLPVP